MSSVTLRALPIPDIAKTAAIDFLSGGCIVWVYFNPSYSCR
jgi:hypothetical protein